MEIIIHRNISDLYKSLNLPLGQETDFTIHFKPDILREIPFKSPTFRADYFSFSFIKDGSGFYTIDENKFSFGSRTIYFTNPGHLKSYEVVELKDAYMITFTENYLRENVHSEIFDEFPFLLSEIVPPKTLSEEKFIAFEILCKQILDEYRKPSLYKNKILGNLFVVLLLKLKEEFWLNYSPIAEGKGNSQIVKSFKQLLESEFKKVNGKQHRDNKVQVRYIAKRLNLHPNYLSSVIKTKTGKTVNEWIAIRTFSTAKSLLKNTTLSVKEIAHTLGYSEPTHFNRFFRQQQKATPLAYRRSLHSLK